MKTHKNLKILCPLRPCVSHSHENARGGVTCVLILS